MDYKELAEILFPQIKKDVDYFEKMYPVRKLPAGAEVTRFAPSPTGYLHIGHFLGALIDYKIARVSDGVFIFRSEDTDGKREVEGAGLVAVSVLEDYGITFDEGLTAKGKQFGNYGPYIQSQRKEIYQTYAKHLVAKGRAFPCFCQKAENIEDVLDRRVQQLQEKSTLLDHDVCRHLTLEEIKYNLQANKPFAIRLKSMGDVNNKLMVIDEIKGEREISENCKDAVLLKSNGIPPYAFAHAVDDHLMRTTLVVRGEEWFPSLPLHLEIFDALDHPRMRYAHTPLICKLGENGNKRKLSKRFDREADMRYFEQVGYPKQAVLEYLLTLANTNFEEWRLQNPQEDINKFIFSVAKINNSNPMFDIAKLNDISKNIIAKMQAETVYQEVLNWAESFNTKLYDILKANKQKAISTFSIDRYVKNPRKDITKWEDIEKLFDYIFMPYQDVTVDKDQLKKFDTKLISAVMQDYAGTFNEEWEKPQWFENGKSLAKKHNFCTDNKIFKATPHLFNGNLASFFEIVRVVLTGNKNSPDLFSICKVLGKQEIANRASAWKQNH